ncbi:MAG: DUF6789 family protein [Trueperaceae bacterium]
MYIYATEEHRTDEARPTASVEDRLEGLLEYAPVRGAIAGALATVPMTLSMYAMDRLVPHEEGDELPPRQITEELAERTGTKENAQETTLDLATEAAHFGFGSVTGAIYGSLAGRVPLPSTVAGIGFGLAVWTASYAGALPGLGLQRPPDRRPAWRNLTMIAGHVVWGAALGWSEQRLRNRRRAVAWVPGERQGRDRGVGRGVAFSEHG